MLKNQTEKKRYEDELMLFYHKYLNIGIGEAYLSNLVEKYGEIWLNKKERMVGSIPSSSVLEKAYMLEVNEEDYRLFTKLEQEFINFYPMSLISVYPGLDIIIDQMGMIKKFSYDKELASEEKKNLDRFIGMNIFAFLDFVSFGMEKDRAIKEAEDIILQNILASKIVKAAYEKIEEKNGQLSASLFAITNARLFRYEDDLKFVFDYEERFSHKLSRVRSLR